MCETVLNQMINVYNERIHIFKDESLDIFIKILNNSFYRRCIPNEIVMIEDSRISII